MIEIAADELLGAEFVMRGGTCLHKLQLPRPYRYSEDLDYVRRSQSGIGPYLDRLRLIAADVGLTWTQVQPAGQMVHVVLDAEATTRPGRIRIKIETNIAETDFFEQTTAIGHAVENGWWSGKGGYSHLRPRRDDGDEGTGSPPATKGS
jgi:predicted nucleotidyltransferase component of viral defense system